MNLKEIRERCERVTGCDDLITILDLLDYIHENDLPALLDAVEEAIILVGKLESYAQHVSEDRKLARKWLAKFK